MKALYAGTFDPVTHGHLDIINRGVKIFDDLVIGVAMNPRKECVFNIAERIEYLKTMTQENQKNIEVVSYDGLTVDFCRNKGIGVILRGIRNQLDFEYEYSMACINRELANDIETVIVMSDPSLTYVSSSMVKDIVRAKGNIAKFVPMSLILELEERLSYE